MLYAVRAMKRFLFLLPILLVACTAATPNSTDATADMIIVDSPKANQTVVSPLIVSGRARGTWYFEASFPVRLLDDLGNEIAVEPAQADGDWMTTDWVPFQVILDFETTAPSGTVVLQKDNPSGLPEHDASVSVPVKF